VLLSWVLAGFAAIIVGHHAPLRLAATRMDGGLDAARRDRPTGRSAADAVLGAD
jgi:hypothetical protein